MAVETVQRYQDGRAFGYSNRRFAVGTAAGRKYCISGCGTETPGNCWVAA
jgi:hypothetical protein